jgi:hypothetical protein
MSRDGVIRVLVSEDAITWRSMPVLSWQGSDLRDPKFSIRPDSQLLLTVGMRWATPLEGQDNLYSFGMLYNTEEDDWSEEIVDALGKSTWRWAVTWYQGQAYSVGYGGRDLPGCLYRSDDGLHWHAHITPFFPKGRIFTNESSIAFDTHQDKAYCIVRRDKANGVQGLLGEADFPYTQWHWRKLNQTVGGQKLLRLTNGEWVVGTRRIYYPRRRAKTRIQKLDMRSGRLKDWLCLPSSGDCSYVGMIEYQGNLMVSYYSSHHDRQARIYLATIPLNVKKRSLRFQ